MTKNIINIYDNLFDKMAFLKAAGLEFGYRPNTIRNHMMRGIQEIPVKLQEPMHTYIVNWASQELVRKQALIVENS